MSRTTRATGAWTTGLSLALVLLAALLPRLFGVLDKTLWNDEAFSLRIAALPVRELIPAIAGDVHPPLYFLALHGWLALVPADWTARLFSALAGTAAVGVAFLLAREVVGRVRAIAAGLLCAVLPLYVSWAQIGRGYALLLLLALLALLAAARLLERCAEPAGWRSVAPAAVFYALAGGAVLWTHNLALFLLLSINAVAAWRLLAGQFSGWRAVLLWALCQLLVVLPWLAWLPVVLAQTANLQGPQFLVRPEAVLERLGWLLGGYMLWNLLPVAAMLGLAAALAGITRLQPRLAASQLCVAALVLPVAACLGLYLSGRAVFGYAVATLIWTPALVAILVSACLPEPGEPRRPAALARVLLFGGVLLLALRGSWNWYGVTNPGWDAVAAQIAASLRPGDAIAAQTELRHAPATQRRGEVPMHAFVVYWHRLAPADGSRPAPELPPAGSDAELLGWMAARPRIWIPQTPAMPDTTLAARLVALAAARPERWQVERLEIGRLSVTLLTRLGSPATADRG